MHQVLRLKRQVGLEHQHDGAVRQLGDAADAVDVPDDELVRLPYICGAAGRSSRHDRALIPYA